MAGNAAQESRTANEHLVTIIPEKWRVAWDHCPERAGIGKFRTGQWSHPTFYVDNGRDFGSILPQEVANDF